jgi:hypothetical protein
VCIGGGLLVEHAVNVRDNGLVVDRDRERGGFVVCVIWVFFEQVFNPYESSKQSSCLRALGVWVHIFGSRGEEASSFNIWGYTRL